MSTLLLDFFNLITDYAQRRRFLSIAPPKRDGREAQWCRL
jgi:hypothetical protein